MKTTLRPALIWLTLLLASGAVADEHAFHGTVVDAESKEPLQGAVVAVLWTRSPIIRMNGPKYHWKAVEVLTDEQGRFSIANEPGRNWNPFYAINENPWIIVFKPGYGPYPWRHESPKYAVREDGTTYALYGRELRQVFLRGTVVELPKAASREELEEVTDLGDLGGIDRDVPRGSILNLIRLVNEQRATLGLSPITR